MFPPFFFGSRYPHDRAEMKQSCPSVAGVDPEPDELVYGPLTLLEASHLVRSLIRVDPERPGQKRTLA